MSHFKWFIAIILLSLVACTGLAHPMDVSPTGQMPVATIAATKTRPAPAPTGTVLPTLTAPPTSTPAPMLTATSPAPTEWLLAYYHKDDWGASLYARDSQSPLWVFPVDAPPVQSMFYSPDGRQLLFTQGEEFADDLYVMAYSGGEPRRLFSAPASVPGADFTLGEMHWLSGSHDLVIQVEKHTPHIYIASYVILNTDSGEILRTIAVPAGEYGITQALFSPDCHYVVVLSAVGLSLIELESGQVYADILTYPFLGYTDFSVDAQVTWRDDSSFFMAAVPTSQSTRDVLRMQIYHVSLDGQASQVAELPGAYAYKYRPKPILHPDGRLVLYLNVNRLHIWNIEDGSDIALGTMDVRVPSSGISLSPDGRQLVYMNQNGLYWYNLDTKAHWRIAPLGLIFSWSPDSRWYIVRPFDHVPVLAGVDGSSRNLSFIDRWDPEDIRWFDEDTLLYIAWVAPSDYLYLQNIDEWPSLIGDLGEWPRYAFWRQSPK